MCVLLLVVLSQSDNSSEPRQGSHEVPPVLAVKSLKAVEDEDKQDKLRSRAAQWSKECAMMLTLSHPNIIQAFQVPPDIVQIADSRFSLLAMEYCPDGDLRSVLSHSL